MAWDLAIDLQTGDFLWDGKRDLASAQGDAIIQQRIHTRLTIHVGTWIYDQTGTLGSRLWTIFGLGVPQTAETIEMVVREALEPMDDISITNIIINTFDDDSSVVDDPRLIAIQVIYQPVLSDAGVNVSDNSQSYQTPTFLIPV